MVHQSRERFDSLGEMGDPGGDVARLVSSGVVVRSCGCRFDERWLPLDLGLFAGMGRGHLRGTEGETSMEVFAGEMTTATCVCMTR